MRRTGIVQAEASRVRERKQRVKEDRSGDEEGEGRVEGLKRNVMRRLEGIDHESCTRGRHAICDREITGANKLHRRCPGERKFNGERTGNPVYLDKTNK